MEIVIGVLFIVLGVAAIGLPIATSLAAVLVLGWAMVVAGVVHLIGAFRAVRPGDTVTKAIVGLAYLAVAIMMLRNPAWGIASLALVISAAVILEGFVTIVAYFTRTEESDGALWLLLNGVVTLLLGFVVWNLAATRPVLLVSALVAVNFVAGGIARILMALAMQRLRNAIGA